METKSRFERFHRRLATVCDSVAVAVAVFAWLGWWLALREEAAVRPGAAPLALNTVLLVILLGTASVLRHRWPAQKSVTAFGYCAALTVSLLGVLVWFEHLFAFVWVGERWFSRVMEAALGAPIGDVSPITAALLALLAGAFLLQLPPLVRSRLARQAGIGFATTVLLASLLVLLEHLAATPLVYGGRTIPVSLVTAITFALLSVDVFLTEGAMSQPGPILDDSLFDSVPREMRRAGVALLLVLLVAVAIIGTAGYVYLKRQQAQARVEARQDLSAIADLKVAQIANWRTERLADAKLVLDSAALTYPFEQFLACPTESRWTNLVFNWMTACQQNGRYARVLLMDTNQKVRFAVPAQKNSIAPSERAFLIQALRTNHVLVSDLHLSQAVPGYANIDMLVPLLPTVNGTEARSPIGALLLEIDPYEFLYPLIQEWPTASSTAQTYLVRREGDDVLFLNELRHAKGTAFSLRHSLSAHQYPSVLAVLGHTGIVEGRDYRGVPVVAAIRAVPGTTWFLIAKMETAEIYAPVRRQALVVGSVAGLLLLSSTLAVGLLWWQRSVAYYRQVLAQEQQRQALAQRILDLTKHANDIILLASSDWRIVEANDRALQTYGYALADLRRMAMRDLWPPEARAEFDEHIQQVEARDGIILETVHQRTDGTVFPVEISARVIEVAGVKYYQGIFRDITARKQAEEALQKSEEHLHQLSARLLKLQDDERRRLARELHDTTAQKLAAAAVNLSRLQPRAEALDARAQTVLTDTRTLVDQSAKEIRTLSYLLHPPVLETLGLADAVRDYADGFAQRSGLRVDLEIAPDFPKLSEDFELALFRVLQESLANVHRHSSSRTVSIRLFAQDRAVSVEVTDAGSGIPEEVLQALDGRTGGAKLGVGIAGMRERLRQLGGRLEIVSDRGGTTIRALLTLPADFA